MNYLYSSSNVDVGNLPNDTYRPCNKGIVLTSNDVACPVIGIRFVKIHIFVGLVRIFGDVTHVLNL